MLDSYRTILSRPGAALFSATGLLARLPISMVGLGIVLLVQARSGSYALAGSVSAANLVAEAAAAIPQGRLIDRLGQARVLASVITVWGVSLSLLMVAVDAGWPHWSTYLLAAVAGATLPSVGTCVRARWSALLPEPRERATAFALEAVADEGVFMAGPIIVTLLAATVSPVAGLSTAIVIGFVATWAFSLQRATQPVPHPRVVATERPRMPWATIVPLTVASSALGLLFGATEVTTVAFSTEHGHEALSGVLLAVWAAGSLIAGLVTGAVTWRVHLVTRVRVGAGTMCLTMLPLTLVHAIPLMAGVLFVAGFAVAPTLIATMSLAEHVLPTSRLTEGMAFLQTGLVAGVAPGASLAGLVIDAHGASAAYVVSFGGGAVALLATLVARVPDDARPDVPERSGLAESTTGRVTPPLRD